LIVLYGIVLNANLRDYRPLEAKNRCIEHAEIYKPFEENMARGHKIDATVPLSPLLFKRYNSYVAAQLGAMPVGTRAVTFAGYADEIPACYDCESALFRDELKLWIKRRKYDPNMERLGLQTSRSYRGPIGWAPPRL